MDFNNLLRTDDYKFLHTNEHLKNKLCIIGLGGSHAYGTNVATSDVDIRGVCLNTKDEILLSQDFEQVTDNKTDTTIYSINKMIKLLTGCNPNVLELLGLKPEHYLYKSEIGELLIENRKLFLSKVVIQSFGGYATAQLRRLDNKSGRLGDAHIQNKHIANSMNSALYHAKSLCAPFAPGEYFGISCNEKTNELEADICLVKYPLDDIARMFTEVSNVRNDYKKLGCRNSKAIEHNKIGKHMMHLFRLLNMGIEILEDEEINTYREDDHDFLMSVRNNEYLDQNGQPTDEFWVLLDSKQKQFDYAAEWTSLPDKPDLNQINDLRKYINQYIIYNNI